MTDLSIERYAEYRATSRPWLWGPHGTEPGTNPTIALDFTNGGLSAVATDGYVKSGTVLGKITATGKYGVFDPAATDGRQTAAGLLFDDVKVPTGTVTGNIGAPLYVHGMVRPDKLPIQTGAGSATTAARASLNLIHWA